LSEFRSRRSAIPDTIYGKPESSGSDTVLFINAVIILGFLRLFGEYIGLEKMMIAVGVAAICFVLFGIYIVIATFLLKRACGYRFIDMTFEKGFFGTFVMKPPDELLDNSTLKILFLGEILLSFIPAVISVVFLFLSQNLYYIVAAFVMCDFGFLFCFKKDGNLTKFGRYKLLQNDYTSADIIARTILIAYKRGEGERLRDMPKMMFIAPNIVNDMYDFRQLVFAYSYALETNDYDRAIKLTAMVTSVSPKTTVGITELHCVTADRLLALILGGAPETEIKKLYADNRIWLLETYSNNSLNIRVQTTLYAYMKLVLREKAAGEAQKSVTDRFWEFAEMCGDSCLVGAYAEKLLEIENKSK
jgi:hypothetical protein